MNWVTAIVLYVLIWWTALFAVLPIGTQAVSEADPASGWRGAPARVRLGRKILITTLVAAAIWLAAYLLVRSPWLSFREGWLAMPSD